MPYSLDQGVHVRLGENSKRGPCLRGIAEDVIRWQLGGGRPDRQWPEQRCSRYQQGTHPPHDPQDCCSISRNFQPFSCHRTPTLNEPVFLASVRTTARDPSITCASFCVEARRRSTCPRRCALQRLKGSDVEWVGCIPLSLGIQLQGSLGRLRTELTGRVGERLDHPRSWCCPRGVDLIEEVADEGFGAFLGLLAGCRRDLGRGTRAGRRRRRGTGRRGGRGDGEGLAIGGSSDSQAPSAPATSSASAANGIPLRRRPMHPSLAAPRRPARKR